MKKSYYWIGGIVLLGILLFAFRKQIFGGSNNGIPECNSLGLDQSQIDTLKSQGKCK